MGFFELDGHRIWCSAKGAGAPLLFLHNGGNDHRIWEQQVEHFSNGHSAYVLDHLGFGRSDKPDVDYTLELYVRQIEAFVAAEGLGRLTLVGHCMGGGMALGYALAHPERVERLVLANVATRATTRAGLLKPAVRLLEGRRRTRDLVAALLDRVRWPKAVTDRVVALQHGRSWNTDAAFCDYQHELYNRPGQLRALVDLCRNAGSWGALDAVEKPAEFPPTLLLWGEENRVLPIAAGRTFAARLRPDLFEVIPGAGHLLMRERAAVVNARIERFLTFTPERRLGTPGTGTPVRRSA